MRTKTIRDSPRGRMTKGVSRRRLSVLTGSRRLFAARRLGRANCQGKKRSDNR